MIDFEYEVIRRPRRRTASISVRRDNAVVVIVPSRLPQRQIEQIVRSKAHWIQSKLRFNEAAREKHRPKEYISGESFAYLGRNYRLKVADGKIVPATLQQGRIHVSVPHELTGNDREQHIIRELTAWYQGHAVKRLQEKTARYAEQMGVTPAKIGIKAYRSRWGSCHKDGRIYFNWRIIMAPQSVVDYVVVHELCHLVHHNHARDFWKLVETIMPSYRKARAWLKVNGEILTVL